ncbi:hypothetical protein SPI_02252 [Niveomyces insectorum RCEF 264]|uniref:Uncharacterized protein n=1 Tax=Niveomyces insectorum RCEF 264 TaxID=1081102 RepID=A0A167XVQ7_9HYPO|nr:hypothetical protein SPI_02252 [Niveomyces insectorum RCEF 264]
MDESAALNYFQDILQGPVLALLYDHIVRDDAPLRLWSRAVAAQTARGVAFVQPYFEPYAKSTTTAASAMVSPLLDRLVRAAYNAPDVVVLLGFVLLVVLVVQVLALLRRLVAWWTRLAFRLLFWSGVVLLAAAVWQRGLAQAAQDAAALTGRLLGYAAFVRDIWRAEYRRYEQQQVQAEAASQHTNYHSGYQQQPPLGGGGGGGGGGRGGWSGRGR